MSSLQLVYERIFGQEARGWRNLPRGIAWIGVVLFAATAVFTLVTLPVEFDASRRAKRLLVSEGILNPQEIQGVNEVLDAAALTYVAAALQAVMTLLYYVFLLTGNSRRR